MAKSKKQNSVIERIDKLRKDYLILDEESVKLVLVSSNLLSALQIQESNNDKPITMLIKNIFDNILANKNLSSKKEELLLETKKHSDNFNIQFMLDFFAEIKNRLRNEETDTKDKICLLENTMYNEILLPKQRTFLAEMDKFSEDEDLKFSKKIKELDNENESQKNILERIEEFSNYTLNDTELKLDKKKINFIEDILTCKYEKNFIISLKDKLSLTLNSIKLFLADYTPNNTIERNYDVDMQNQLIDILSKFLISISKREYEKSEDKLKRLNEQILGDNSLLRIFACCSSFLGDCCCSNELNANKELINWDKIRNACKYDNDEVDITNFEEEKIMLKNGQKKQEQTDKKDKVKLSSESEKYFAQALLAYNKKEKNFKTIICEKSFKIDCSDLTEIKEKSFAELSGYTQKVDFFTITKEELEMCFEVDGDCHFKGKIIPFENEKNNISKGTKIRDRLKEIIIAQRYKNKLLEKANILVNNEEISNSISNRTKLIIMTNLGVVNSSEHINNSEDSSENSNSEPVNNSRNSYRNFVRILRDNNSLQEDEETILKYLKTIVKNVKESSSLKMNFKNIRETNQIIAKNKSIAKNIFLINAMKINSLNISNNLDENLEKLIDNYYKKSNPADISLSR